MVDQQFWRNKRVAITGNTGFKGTWLQAWLSLLGADVFGYALAPEPNGLYLACGFEKKPHQTFADIRDAKALREFIVSSQPDVIFHLAAQPLVLESYRNPAYTWETNVMGTMNLLEAVRELNRYVAVVVVTTDKVYANVVLNKAYKESDNLGGYDPYSSSKAATEILAASWRSSFYWDRNNIYLATARAGNVIGGGDWAVNRIIPDLVRSIQAKQPAVIRNPHSIRPWQHVLESLSGYLTLAQKLYNNDDSSLHQAYNFGPDPSTARTVADLINLFIAHWGEGSIEKDTRPSQAHEADYLELNIERAAKILDWHPTWNFEQTIQETVDWYKAFLNGEPAFELMQAQIKKFSQLDF
jgi:CDP-glucose 4,6-dehydratase